MLVLQEMGQNIIKKTQLAIATQRGTSHNGISAYIEWVFFLLGEMSMQLNHLKLSNKYVQIVVVVVTQPTYNDGVDITLEDIYTGGAFTPNNILVKESDILDVYSI